MCVLQFYFLQFMRQNKERKKRIDDATVRWSFFYLLWILVLAIPNNLWAYRERPIQTKISNQSNIRKYYLFSHHISFFFKLGKSHLPQPVWKWMIFWSRCTERKNNNNNTRWENRKKSKEKHDENERKSTKIR